MPGDEVTVALTTIPKLSLPGMVFTSLSIRVSSVPATAAMQRMHPERCSGFRNPILRKGAGSGDL